MTALLAVACSLVYQEAQPVTRRVQLTMTNHWEFLNTTIVHVNQQLGSRLQVFSELEDAVFDNVIITYSIVDAQTKSVIIRVLSLTQSGRGDTMPCVQAFPRILGLSGSVEFKQQV